jgi:hypothetical protein
MCVNAQVFRSSLVPGTKPSPTGEFRCEPWAVLASACFGGEVTVARQRQVFVALVVDGVPLDALETRTGASRNAIYETMFDARRKLRAALVANG